MQKFLIDNDKELRISLNIYLMHDFKMEILSFGENVKITEPQNFAKEMKKLSRYVGKIVRDLI